METYLVLKDLAIIIVFAKFFGLVARKCKAPMVVGEILAGIIIGPLLSLVDYNSSDHFLAYMSEIGVILIMFSAGLETNLKEIKKSGFMAFLIACAGVAVPFIGGTLLYIAFHGFEGFGTPAFSKAIFIGSIMTATSVGITVETLKELGFLKGRIGQTILSAAIIDDVIGIIVLTFVIAQNGGNADPTDILIKTASFFAITIVGGVLFYKLFKKVDHRYVHTRRIPIIGLALCFGLAYIAEAYFKIADITGAYLAGIILCNIEDAGYIDRKVTVSNYMIFGPIFFACIGLKTDFSSFNMNMLWFSVAFVAVACLTKILGCGLCAKCFKIKNIDCLKVGIGMMTRGEVALIITQKGQNLKIIDESYSTPVIMLIIFSSVLVPILLKLLYTKAPDPESEAVA